MLSYYRSDQAQATTRHCAEKAGMGNMQIITEPEAAGIYALKNMRLGLKEDDTFVLCDAGGGYVLQPFYKISHTLGFY